MKLCTLFPEYDNLEMYNRRKNDTIAEDIYIIGYSTVNQLKDRRLSKVMKPGGATNATNANDVSLVESGDLIETCMSLRGTVTVLTTAVANFTNELITLREKVSQLEMRLDHGVGIPGQVAMGGNNTQQAAVHHTSTAELADPDTGIQPPSDDTGVQAEANVVAVPPEEPSQPVAVTTEDNPMNGENEDGDNDFRLPGHQRRPVIRGFKLQSSNRTIINGSSSANFKVKRARSDDTRLLHTVYVGKLRAETSDKDVRAHLRDIGVAHVSEVSKLHCRTEGESSFCVSVDSLSDEDTIFDPCYLLLGANV